jgi:hypothetical protein
MPAQIDRQHAKAAARALDQRPAPGAAGLAAAMQQDDGRPVGRARLVVGEIDIGAAVAARLRVIVSTLIGWRSAQLGAGSAIARAAR